MLQICSSCFVIFLTNFHDIFQKFFPKLFSPICIILIAVLTHHDPYQGGHCKIIVEFQDFSQFFFNFLIKVENDATAILFHFDKENRVLKQIKKDFSSNFPGWFSRTSDHPVYKLLTPLYW